MLHCLLCLLTFFCLYRLALRGYPLLALLFLPLASGCCWRLARQRLVGASISWRQGNWTLVQAGGCSSAVSIHRSSTCLPWLIYLAWVDSTSGRRGSAFLLPDSVPAQQWRGLRVRLSLER